MNKNLTIMITGAGSTMGQSVMKALLMSKYADKLRLIITNSESLGASYYMSEKVEGRYLVPVAKDPNYISKIIEICNKEKVDGIFSGTEHEIYALSNAAEKIKETTGAIVFLSRPEVIDIGTDKYKTYLYFKENGIPFPETVLFDDYEKLEKMVGYPFFMKPRTASASRHIYKINNREELFQKKFDDSSKIVLQEYLDSDQEYTVESFCDRNGNVVGTIAMVRELGFGMSISGEIVEHEGAIAVSELICKTLKPEGAINVQLRIVGNKAIPFEINTRFSSTECIRAYYGYNSVEAAIDNYLYGLPVDLNNWRTGMFMRYWHECYFEKSDMPTT